jgi:hypothetical protein
LIAMISLFVQLVFSPAVLVAERQGFRVLVSSGLTSPGGLHLGIGAKDYHFAADSAAKATALPGVLSGGLVGPW